MERCSGFTVPENGQFYVVSFDCLVYYQLNNEIIKGKEIEQSWDIDLKGKDSSILLEEKKIPFIGVWGGSPIHKREGIGELHLKNSAVSLTNESGEIYTWKFENFSGDWEQITFDRYSDAFLFGAPYDLDFRYVLIN